jgi:hypothetical protein
VCDAVPEFGCRNYYTGRDTWFGVTRAARGAPGTASGTSRRVNKR